MLEFPENMSCSSNMRFMYDISSIIIHYLLYTTIQLWKMPWAFAKSKVLPLESTSTGGVRQDNIFTGSDNLVGGEGF